MSKYPGSVASFPVPVPTVAVSKPWTSIFNFSYSLATFPWQLFLMWLSWSSTLLLNGVTYLGAQPTGFIPNNKLQELNGIINHMHRREDIYRKAIKELQDDIDAKNTDRRKAFRRLKHYKAELDTLTEQLTTLQREYADAVGVDPSQEYTPGTNSSIRENRYTDFPSSPRKNNNTSVMHFSMGVTILSIWWFVQTEHPSILWKLLFAMFFPLLWLYVSWLMDSSRHERPLFLLCASWFITGFVASQRVAAGREYDYGDMVEMAASI